MDNLRLSCQSLSKILHSSGYDDGNIGELINPLFSLENTVDCLNWSCNYISEQNVPTAEELEDYEEWVNNNFTETDDAFDGYAQECHQDAIADSVENLRPEIKTSNVLIECLDEHKTKLRTLEENANDCLSQCKKQAQVAQQELTNAKHDFGKHASNLDSPHSRLVERFSNLGSALQEIYNATSENPQLLTQISQDRFIKQSEECIQLITMLLKQFNMKLAYLEEENHEVLLFQQYFLAKDTNTTSTVSKLLEKLRLFSNLFLDTKIESLVVSVEVQVVLESIKCVQTYLRQIQNSKYFFSVTQLKYQLKENIENISKSDGVLQELVTVKLARTVKQEADVYLKQALVNRSEACKRKQQYDLDRIYKLEHRNDVQILLSDVLWLMLTNEERRLQDIACILQEYCKPLSTDMSSMCEQKEIMRSIKSEFTSNQQDMRGSFRKILKLLVSVPDENSYEYLFESLNELSSRIKLNEQELLDHFFQASNKILNKSKKKINCLERYVMPGGTKKPVISNIEHFTQLNKMELFNANLIHAFSKLIHDVGVLQDSLRKNPSLRKKQQLWIYFLTSDKKLEELINNLIETQVKM